MGADYNRSMKRSSRARLNLFTERAFVGDDLFNTLGRAVSRAQCLPRKEFFEAWAVAKRVRRRLRGDLDRPPVTEDC